MRLAVAGQPVIDEAQAARLIDGGRGDAPRTTTALAYADALMTRPGEMSGELVAALHEHFTDVELVELTLKVLKFNLQKVTVACGHDVTMTAELIADQAWAADGSFVAAPAH